MYRKGIRYMLSQDDNFTIIGESTTRIETYEKVISDLPDLVIMDADSVEFSGIDITNNITQNLADVNVILIMDNQNTQNILSAIKSGAKACLSNIADQNILKNTIKKVIQGKILISQYLLEPDISTSILNEFRALNTIYGRSLDLPATLSPIEEVILVKISDGTLIKDITSSLNISEEEFASLLESIVQKLVDVETYKRRPKSDIKHQPSYKKPEETIKERQEMKTPTEDLVTSAGSISEKAEQLFPEEEISYFEGKMKRVTANRETEKFDISEKEILKMVQLAREAERLSAFEEVNGEMRNILETLNDEIERRQRSLRRVYNAIEEELEFGKNLELTWNRFHRRKTMEK